ncbi:MAG: histidine kinase [Jatrophihabitans sp.]|uniref:histidine kinase n=1 Tax=Jatrophihabitans sp. TaxID=1932789 RepID=UPI00390E191C
MTGLSIMSIALGGVWAVAAIVVLQRWAPATRLHLALSCAGAAVTHVLAAMWPELAPLVLGAWFVFALAVPGGALGTAPRRVFAAVALAATVGWAVVLEVVGDHPPMTGFVIVAVAGSAGGAVASIARYAKGGVEEKRILRWLAAGSVLAAAFIVVCLALDLMTDKPHPLPVWVAAGLLFVPIALVLSAIVTGTRASAAVLLEAIAAAGLAALVVIVYLVVVVGINGSPHGHERDVLIASLAAALVVAALAVPVRRRLIAFADRLIGATDPSTDEVVSGFGARMSRAVPMDELMLQLVESLRASVAPAGAEIWTGAGGALARTVSVPSRGAERIELSEQDRIVVGRARIGGPSWTAVWLPTLAQPAGGDLRVVPVAHLGELLGLIVVRRRPVDEHYTEDDERALVEVARQLGLALHNVRLDSALQASLAELAERNEELQASRLRIVTAADSSRRAIERNLHDGAQQHLVALAVKLGLARSIAEDGDTGTVLGLLEDLRADVQTTIGELRELAHGIYPPLLRDRGLGEALRTAATRSPLPCSVDVDLPGRYAEEIETAAYFCCLEAMQNAGKYAGDGATITVRLHGTTDVLCCELSDDGAGFDASTTSLGHGFLNMKDRLGAIGGELTVESTPGGGTVVRASIPAQPLETAAR